MHVQVDLDQRALGDPRPQLGVAAGVVAARQRGAGRSPPARPRPRPSRARRRRLDQLVGGREVALQQLARSPALVTVRASMRPKKISTSGRATWVESTRSCGAWKVATLSE